MYLCLFNLLAGARLTRKSGDRTLTWLSCSDCYEIRGEALKGPIDGALAALG
jgi:hypothetical protein